VLAGLEELKVWLKELRVWLEELRVWLEELRVLLAECAANPLALVGRSLCEGRSPSFCASELNGFWELDPCGLRDVLLWESVDLPSLVLSME
jgi:hypothetical protein